MLLTKTETRRISIVCAIAEGMTIAQVAERFDVSDSCVNSAISWGKAHHLFHLSASSKIEQTKSALEKRYRFLERQRKLHEKAARDRDELTGHTSRIPVPSSFLQIYMREGRELIMAIAELDGIYKHTLNVNIDANITHHIDYGQYSDDELRQLQALKEKAIVHGDN